MLANSLNPVAILNVGEVQAAAPKLGLVVNTCDVKGANDIAPAIEQLTGRTQALYVVGDSLVFDNQVQINTLALVARLPTMFPQRDTSRPGADLLRNEFPRPVPTCCRNGRQDFARRKTRRHTSRAADKVRACDQPQDRESARPRSAATLLARADEVIE